MHTEVVTQCGGRPWCGLLCAAVVFTLLSSAGPARADLIHRYTFDSDALDSVGSAHGTPLGGVGYDAVNRVAGSASLLLDGVNDGISLGSVTYPAGAFSVSVWARHDGSQLQTLTFWGNATWVAESSGYKFLMNSWASNNGRLLIDTGNGSVYAGTASASGAFAADNQFHHVVATFNRSAGVGEIYYDGVLVATGQVRSDGAVSGLNAYIGQLAGNLPFRGNLDDFQVYDTVLSASEVAFIHDNPGQTAPIAPASIPTLSEWGLFVLGALLLASLLVAQRKRAGLAGG